MPTPRTVRPTRTPTRTWPGMPPRRSARSSPTKVRRVDAITFPPAPTNEPNLMYAPGSPEREALVVELDKLEREQHTLRAHVDGRWLDGGGAEIEVVQPHDHQHVLGTMRNSTTQDAEAAVK